MFYFNQNFTSLSLNKLSQSNVNFIEQILSLLDGKMPTPTLYGWYHLLCLALVFSLCIHNLFVTTYALPAFFARRLFLILDFFHIIYRFNLNHGCYLSVRNDFFNYFYFAFAKCLHTTRLLTYKKDEIA